MNPYEDRFDTKRILHTLARKDEVATKFIPNGTEGPQRHTALRQAAQALSRRNVDTAIVQLYNEALSRLTELCYEKDSLGVFVNIDSVTGRLLIPAPWGHHGYKKWGLTQLESRVLRRILLIRQTQGIALFHFERSRLAWFLNVADYGEGVCIEEWSVSVAEFRAARRSMRGA